MLAFYKKHKQKIILTLIILAILGWFIVPAEWSQLKAFCLGFAIAGIVLVVGQLIGNRNAK